MKADSVADLRRIFHGVVSTVGALEGIGRPISDGTDLFVHLVVELLDAKTRREWENSLGKSPEPPQYEALREFLQEQLMTQEELRAVSSDTSGKSAEKSGRSARANHAKGRGADSSRSCPLCKKEHFMAFCEQYKKKSAQEKREAVNTHQRCWNCLGRHMVGECSSVKTCSKCSGRHHTSLHEAFTSATAIALPSGGPGTSPTVHMAKQPPAECASVLLATARVLVMDRSGARHSVRALVDPGSETSLIAESLAQRLRLPRTPTSVSIFGVGGVHEGLSRGRVAFTLSARSGQFAFSVSSLVLPRLSVYSGVMEGETRSWPHVHGLELADPEFFSRDPIELLLGAEAYATIVLPELRRGGPLEPCSPVEDLATAVRRFWEWEEPPHVPVPLSASEQECEDHFLRTHRRLPDGRYQVRLPARADLPDLGFTRRAASRMLDVMARRFERDVDFRDKYRDFMDDYIARGHMSPVPRSLPAPGGPVCFLPHHGVLKGIGADAKIRVVFNGSSRTAVNASLNDALHTGPNLLPVLADVVMRWRRHRYVFIADVEKMYRQIMVHPEDRDLQRILWRRKEEIEYRLNTVTYGLACAPYLAIRVLRQLATDDECKFPLGAEALRRDIYMDDVLTGASSLEVGCRLQEQISSLCMAGGFPLRKWAANHGSLLKGVPLEHRLQLSADALLPSVEHSVLGLRWSPATDDFALTVRRSTGVPPTKRTILSQTARLFDPLGWLAPILIRAKLIIQATWLQQLEWDAPLADEEAATWATLEEELPLVEQIRVPRWFRGDPASRVEVHGFSDASEQAYAAVVYLRVIEVGLPHISLVKAKTRVAPLKRISLPRLELCTVALLAKLAEHVRTTLSLDASPVFLWTDSTVTLSWIHGHPAKWTTFVANRVAEIQRTNQDAKWRHVPGRINPADCASRGVSPRELLEHPLWWRGPSFLLEDSAAWPADPGLPHSTELPERRTAKCLASCGTREPEELARFSSLRRLLRVSAWIWRWRMRCASFPNQGVTAPTQPMSLGPEELDCALTRWIRVAQAVALHTELKDIRAGHSVSGRSLLRKLTPEIDAEGILRVGGRIKHAQLDFDQRHPIILPSDSRITYLVIDAAHRRTLHGGAQATLAAIRQRYWIPRGRQLVRRFIHRCLPCVRWRAATPQPLMGSLPRARVTSSRPFLHTGVDFAGPIWLRTSKGRGHKAYKAFLSVFVCFSSRAVHLEVVSDYTADAFIAAFRRFVARRGVCQAVYSDCGTNFVGADKQLRALFQAASSDVHRIIGRLADDGIRWHFNPPAAPHFGGLWEAAALTDDPEDLGALTPGHFLIGGPLNAIPEPSLLDVPVNRLSRWRMLQQMRDHLWQRWSREYLQGLTPRPKWWSTPGNMREGQLYLLKAETTPPCRWPLARITRLHPGDDGQVRVVDVRTANGELTRPVVKVVPLPTADFADPEPHVQ
ncbi:hypothetical protein RF55_12480 [Lasius niger]|uniref:Peptidase A2 domain-containing protein n=1 Tax=Lasius niger TaxID=67767 RepID=A0A0J7N5Z0_LASNI|nr:hypothetical protein RF55_12480 [Lasius niger]